MHVVSGRRWRTVWTRLSQGENHSSFLTPPLPNKQPLLNIHTNCGFGNKHLWFLEDKCCLPAPGSAHCLHSIYRSGSSRHPPSHAALVGSAGHYHRLSDCFSKGAESQGDCTSVPVEVAWHGTARHGSWVALAQLEVSDHWCSSIRESCFV